MVDSSSSSSYPTPSSPHVLVVDDSLFDRQLVERLFTRIGCKVTTAENGQKAIELLGLGDEQCTDSNGSNVNLIITDYCMPEITGYELLKKVKESSSMKEIPVVVVSSEEIPTRIKECKEAGALEFLPKPLKLADIEKLKSHITSD